MSDKQVVINSGNGLGLMLLGIWIAVGLLGLGNRIIKATEVYVQTCGEER